MGVTNTKRPRFAITALANEDEPEPWLPTEDPESACEAQRGQARAWRQAREAYDLGDFTAAVFWQELAARCSISAREVYEYSR